MRAILTAFVVVLFATAAWAAPDNPGIDDNNGVGNDPQGRSGQKGQPGQEGVTGPAIEDGPQWLKGFVVATHTGDHENPDRDQGGGNDPNSKAAGQTQNPNPGK